METRGNCRARLARLRFGPAGPTFKSQMATPGAARSNDRQRSIEWKDGAWSNARGTADSGDTWVLLDALRRKRNANDYTGAAITPDMTSECLAQAKALRSRLHNHLAGHHPDLLNK